MDDEPGDRGRVGVGQVPVQGAVEIPDRHRAVHIDRPIRLRSYAGQDDFVLIGDP